MHQGFVIRSIIDVPGWRSFCYFDWPVEVHGNCPICDERLQVVVAIVSQSTNERLHVGTCPLCGLTTYIQKPTASALASFYARDWMGETLHQALVKAGQLRKEITVQLEGNADLSDPVLEVGCGYGGQVHLWQQLGFTDINGVEACPVRAEAVRQVYGVRVYDGDFCDPELVPDRHYNMILASHVLEHCLDPVAFVRRCFAIQRPGGTLVLSLPNFYAEPSMGVVMFAPHQYSFTAMALERLLNKCGYIIERIDKSQQLQVVARKNVEVGLGLAELNRDVVLDNGNLGLAVKKLLFGLGLVQDDQRYLTWRKHIDGAVHSPSWHEDAIAQQAVDLLPRRILIDNIRERLTNAPIEIQFEGRIQLFCK